MITPKIMTFEMMTPGIMTPIVYEAAAKMKASLVAANLPLVFAKL